MHICYLTISVVQDSLTRLQSRYQSKVHGLLCWEHSVPGRLGSPLIPGCVGHGSLLHQSMQAKKDTSASKIEVSIFCSIITEVKSLNVARFYWLKSSCLRGNITQGSEYWEVEITRDHLTDCLLPRWLSGKEPACQCRRCGFNPWVGKIPWKRKWQPTPVFLPGEFHGQRNLMGYSPCGRRVRHD